MAGRRHVVEEGQRDLPVVADLGPRRHAFLVEDADLQHVARLDDVLLLDRGWELGVIVDPGVLTEVGAATNESAGDGDREAHLY